MAKLRTPYLNPRFAAAVDEFRLALKKTSSIQHRGYKGGAREDAFRTFLSARLRRRYQVVSGEAVDLFGNSSPELDVMIFDGIDNFAFHTGTSHVLPAEALLASIEVKSVLNKLHVENSLAAARRLRILRPYGHSLGGRNTSTAKEPGKKARYYHCVFAYETSLPIENWMNAEASRFLPSDEKEHLIDAVYVLNRGTINIHNKMAQMEDANGSAICSFYFSILNFLERESARRPSTPVGQYVQHPQKAWTKIG